jgi:hypothetical protein
LVLSYRINNAQWRFIPMRETLDKIWRNTSGFVFLPYRTAGIWHERPGINLAYSEWPLLDDLSDLYFSPLVFDRPERNNESVSWARVLFADVDHGVYNRIAPTILWETSPGSYQAVWELSRFIPIEQFNDLNRRLTYHIDADRGGWHASKVLRIPGSLNWKRVYHDGIGLHVPRGVLLYDDGPVYDPDRLEEALPAVFPVPDDAGKAGPMPSPLGDPDTIALRGTLVAQGRLPKHLHSWLLQRWSTDRSALIWRTACGLAMCGVTVEEAFQLIRAAEWNKWRNEPEKLWRDIHKAYRFVQQNVPNEYPSGG